MTEKDSTPRPENKIEQRPFTTLLFESFERMGPKRALTFMRGNGIETRLSYHDLNRASGYLSAHLSEMGVKQGDRVLLFLPKCVYWVAAHLAILKIGAISVTLNPDFKKRELEFFIQASNPALAVVGQEQQELVSGLAPDLSLISFDREEPFDMGALEKTGLKAKVVTEQKMSDPGMIIFTSGTTGQPKGAVLTLGNLSHDVQNISAIWEMSQSDVLCHALPLFHTHGLCFALHTSFLAGASVVMLDVFSPDRVFELLSQNQGELVCSLFMAVPTMYSRLTNQPPDARTDFSHIRLLTSGSAPLLVRDFERIREVFGQEPVEREGMSETGMNFSNPLHGPRKAGSIGLPLPGLEVRILDPETKEDVPAGETGEIWLKGPGVTPGYWKRPEETEKAFVHGWFRTGDLGRRDPDGYYFLTDRLKHIIISGGENISPKEIEQVINNLEGVVECAVVGIPDPAWGEKVVAAVKVRPDSSITSDTIQAQCKETLLAWKCPKEILFIDELPKNQMGKVLKNKVEALF
ncbi:MAG: AMP-binding protein [Deltaproteobacteria bacterium]|nr:AMP-binding protein [Deltaproteobacteria bacterium]